jgi:hypothetical protein
VIVGKVKLPVTSSWMHRTDEPLLHLFLRQEGL